LHSGSSAVPSLCANRIVAIRPMLSCSTFNSRAAVGLADASPTPTPGACVSGMEVRAEKDRSGAEDVAPSSEARTGKEGKERRR
jgi:hypothetical protein